MTLFLFLIFYGIFATLMFTLWSSIGAHMRKTYKRPSWPTIWVISIFAGLLWPISLAYIIIHMIVSTYG